MDEGIVECCQDMADAKSVFSLLSSSSNGRSVIDNLFLLNFGLFVTFTFGTTLLFLSF
jgi:hypothetical protein